MQPWIHSLSEKIKSLSQRLKTKGGRIDSPLNMIDVVSWAPAFKVGFPLGPSYLAAVNSDWDDGATS